MKFKLKSVEVLNGEVLDTPQPGNVTCQANITYEVVPEVQNHVVPEDYRFVKKTFFNIIFAQVADKYDPIIKKQKALEKLREIYGNENVIE